MQVLSNVEGEWKQLFTSPLYTHSDLHAAYAFISLMFLGWRYERSRGPVRFAIRIVVTTAATGLVHCCLARALAESDDLVVAGAYRYEMEHKCFTGATAVILALKITFGVDGLFAEGWWQGSPGTYPFLWFALPVHPVLGAFFEAVLLESWFPFLWTPGHVAGVAVGVGYAMALFVLKKLF
ncbi:rhomboid-related protein 4-like [Haemaphysalis longicornis]